MNIHVARIVAACLARSNLGFGPADPDVLNTLTKNAARAIANKGHGIMSLETVVNFLFLDHIEGEDNSLFVQETYKYYDQILELTMDKVFEQFSHAPIFFISGDRSKHSPLGELLRS